MVQSADPVNKSEDQKQVNRQIYKLRYPYSTRLEQWWKGFEKLELDIEDLSMSKEETSHVA
jgi:hypothetical protein